MLSPWLVLGGILLCCGEAGAVESGAGGLRLALRLPEGERYLLGQPVPLTAVLENAGDKARELYESPIEELDPNVKIFLAAEGGPFSPFDSGRNIVPSVVRVVRTLAPGSRRYYTSRVVYDRQSDNRLALAAPGRYKIRARYLWVERGESHSGSVESNTVEVQVDAPQGPDAEVWARIQRPAMLHFLQTGVALGKPSGAGPGSLSAEVLARIESGEGMPAEAAELVLAHPASRYAAALRQALGEYYYQRKNYPSPGETIPAAEAIRRALGIASETYLSIYLPSRDHPERDERLFRRRVTCHYPDGADLNKVLEQVTLETGVPLGVGAEVIRGRFRGESLDVALYQFMQSLVEPGWAKWVRQGDGYHLEAIVAAAEK